jgi:glycosyltransferase involved in cell wall biosynthesis
MEIQNILLISFEYFPVSQGGLARHAKAIIDRLLKYKGFKAVIAVPKRNEVKIDKQIMAIPCIFFGNKYLCYLEFSLRVFFKFRNRFDKDSFIFFSLLSYFLLPILPKKFYLFVHSNERRVFLTNYSEESIKDRLIRKILYFFNYHWESYLCKKAIKIFSVSPSLKDETVYQYNINKNKITVINNGLDTSIFKKCPKVKKQRKDLLYVGKISYRKNIIDLINVFKLLLDIDPEFKLHIMGSRDRHYLGKVQRKIDEYRLNDKIFFYDYTNDSRLNKLYEKCSVFVSTSLLEGFGLVFLEAMSKGLPIISYYNLGMRHVYPIINNVNGYLIKPFNYKDFVAKILYLYLCKNNKTYETMSKNALKRVDDFSWDASVQNIIKELKKTDML